MKVYVLNVLGNDIYDIFVANDKDKLINTIIDEVKTYHKFDVLLRLTESDIENMRESIIDDINNLGHWRYELSKVDYIITEREVI